MTTLVLFAAAIVLALVALEMHRGAIHRRQVMARIDILAQIVEKVAAQRRDESVVLAAIDKIDETAKQGTIYVGGILANVSKVQQYHEERLWNLEGFTGAGARRPKAPRLVTPAVPDWVPEASRVPPVNLEDPSGSHKQGGKGSGR